MKKRSLFFLFLSFSFFLFAQDNWKFIDSGNNKITISSEIKNIAKKQYSFLNETRYFKDRYFVKKYPLKVREKLLIEEKAEHFFIKTKDNHNLNSLFLDREKNKIIIIGPGLIQLKEHMALFTQIFADYDLLIFDWPGHDASFSALKRFFFLLEDCRLGFREENDVFAVVDWIKNKKRYGKIIGFGSCYGAFIFAKAQAIKEKKKQRLFDKLILFCCWPSVELILKKYSHDPKLMIDNQKGGWNYWFLQYDFCERLFFCIAQSLFRVDIKKLTLDQHLEYIKKIPVLFIHHSKDILIDNNNFENMFAKLATDEKVAFIAPFPHARAHILDKEFFAYICNNFIVSENCANFLKTLVC